MGLKLSQVQDLKTTLTSMPPNDDPDRELSHREVVASIAKEIAGLQARAYTIEDIARLLNGHGVAISVNTLRTYLTRVRALDNKKNSSPKRTLTTTPKKTPAVTTGMSALLATQDAGSDAHQDASPVSNSITAVKPDAGQRRPVRRYNDRAPDASSAPSLALDNGEQDAGSSLNEILPQTLSTTRPETSIPTAHRTMATTRARAGISNGVNPVVPDGAADPLRKVVVTPAGTAMRDGPSPSGGVKIARSSSFEPSADTPDI